MPTFRLTPKRIAWLRHLEVNGTSTREGWRSVPCACMRAGLTEWVKTQPRRTMWPERLTDAGRAALTTTPQPERK